MFHIVILGIMYRIYLGDEDITDYGIINQAISEIDGVGFNENRTFEFKFNCVKVCPENSVTFGYFSKDKYERMKPILYDERVNVSSKLELMNRESTYPLCNSGMIYRFTFVNCTMELTKKGKLIFLSNNGNNVSFYVFAENFYLRSDEIKWHFFNFMFWLTILVSCFYLLFFSPYLIMKCCFKTDPFKDFEEVKEIIINDLVIYFNSKEKDPKRFHHLSPQSLSEVESLN